MTMHIHSTTKNFTSNLLLDYDADHSLDILKKLMLSLLLLLVIQNLILQNTQHKHIWTMVKIYKALATPITAPYFADPK